MRERGGASNVGLACRRVTAFFYYGDDGRGTEPQHAGGFADPAAVERQVVDLAADFRYLASILVLEKKAPPRAPVVDPTAQRLPGCGPWQAPATFVPPPLSKVYIFVTFVSLISVLLLSHFAVCRSPLLGKKTSIITV